MHFFFAMHLFLNRFGFAIEVRDLLLVGTVCVLSVSSQAEVLAFSRVSDSMVGFINVRIELCCS